MTKVEGSIIVPAPVHDVFTYASDYERWTDWFTGVSDFRPMTEVTRGNGARYAYKARLMGLPAAVETEISGFAEDKGWKGTSRKGMAHCTYWLFEPHGEYTRFTYALEYRLPVPILGALIDALFLKRAWRRIIAKSLDNLRLHFTPPRARAAKP